MGEQTCAPYSVELRSTALNEAAPTCGICLFAGRRNLPSLVYTEEAIGSTSCGRAWGHGATRWFAVCTIEPVSGVGTYAVPVVRGCALAGRGCPFWRWGSRRPMRLRSEGVVGHQGMASVGVVRCRVKVVAEAFVEMGNALVREAVTWTPTGSVDSRSVV
jgi:hypothetical protein